MKIADTRLKKALLILGGIFIIVPALVIIFISPIAKYVVEKYSVKYTGRQIKMDWAYVNPFTGYVHFDKLKIYEDTSKSVFISAEGLSVDISLHKLFSKEYIITSVTLDRPIGIAIQKTKDTFNFSDIIKHFSSAPADSNAPPKPPLRLSILNIKIIDGIFYIHDTSMHINYFIKHFNFKSTGNRWDADTFPGTFSFSSGTDSGSINGDFTFNTKNPGYRYEVTAHKFSLDIIAQYLKQMTNYGTFSAYLDGHIKTEGNFKDVTNADTKGRLAISDFHFGKNRCEDYLSFDKFVMVINEVNPEQHIYHLDSVILTHPYFKYEEYDKLDNIETMFGQNGANVKAVSADGKRFNLIIELGHYLVNISKNFFESAYRINNLALNRGNVEFNDFSKNEEFSIAANPLFISADSVYQDKGKIKMTLKAGIEPYGNATVYASVNPRDSEDFDVNFHIQKIPITLFNPYLISYTSFPFDRGTIDFSGQWKVRGGIIKSENHLLIIDPTVIDRLKNKNDGWIPMRLMMYFIRDRGNVIDYEIPVTGNIKSPKFHLHDIVFSTLKNIFVKPPTTPYRIEVNNKENDIEKSLTLKWGMRQNNISPKGQKFLEKIDKFLTDNPAASIVVSPMQYATKEKEYILFYEAKKKYYLSLHAGNREAFSTSDSEYIDKMSIKDPLFVQYLNKHLTDTLVFTIQDKCSNLISPAFVNTKFNQLNKTRKNTFLSYFTGKGLDGKVTFNAAQNTIPYNGFSYYKITYKGELPDYLIKAYDKMDELNNENPREKYQKERGKAASSLTKNSTK